jgi:hypothetical protein
MRTPLKTCSWRSGVAVLASGAIISLSALSGGVAPAFAQPDKNDPGIPVIPTPEIVIPEAPQPAPEQQAPAESPRAQQQPAPPPVVEAPPVQAPAPPPIQAPAPAPETAPQPQAPAPQIVAPPPQPEAPAPQIVAPAPKKERPRVVDAPKVDAPAAPKVDAPKADLPKVDAPKPDVPKADVPPANAPKFEAPKVDVPAPLPAVDEPAKPGDANQDAQVPQSLVPGQTPDIEKNLPGDKQTPAADQVNPSTGGPGSAVDEPKNDSSSASKAAQRVAMAGPETLKAPEQDIELARRAEPIEVKPEPAKKQDIDFLSSALNVQSKTKLGPFESEFRTGSDFSFGDRDRDRDRDRGRDWDNKFWDKKVRQWDRNWIEYDRFYRPIIFNPFRAPVRIVYALANATRILVIQPLARVVVDVAELAAYSFTAVVLGAANVVSDVANAAADVVNVAVGTIFGGGYVPRAGLPFVPPPPLLRYDNVPVQVRYSNATYQPFRVNQIVDVGDDVQYGGRKVLLDGATPAWGQWTTSPSGERQFEVHRTQQYPGLGEPQEAPLPGDYRMQLASGESAGIDRTQMYLVGAAGLVAGLGFGALGLAFALGRRRPQL